MELEEQTRTRRTNPLYFLLALVIAAGIWYYVDTYGNNGNAFSAQQAVTGIPIEYTGERELENNGLMLVNDDDTTTSVDLTFEGARILICQLNRNRIRVSADLSGIDKTGVQTVQYTVSYLDSRRQASIPASQKFARVSVVERGSATVNISELTRKEVDVRCELVGNVAAGYSAGKIQLTPAMVELQGQESELENVSYAKVTLDVGEAAKESVTQRLTCRFYNESDQLIEDYLFRPSTDQIQASLPVSLTKELKLDVDFIEAPGARKKNVSYSIDPESVTVSGEASKLEDLDSIILGEQNLLDLVNMEGRLIHTYSIPIPEGCENLSSASRASVKISFADIASRTVTTSRFAVDNSQLADGKTAEVLTESLDVSIFGTQADVEAVTGNSLAVTPVLRDYAAASGVITVPATVTVRGAGDIGIQGTYEIQVRIRDASEDTDNAGENEENQDISDQEE